MVIESCLLSCLASITPCIYVSIRDGPLDAYGSMTSIKVSQSVYMLILSKSKSWWIGKK